MYNILIFYPVFAQVTLTFVLLYATGRVRLASIRHGEVEVKDIAMGQNAWPERATRFANTYNNQFQLPVLFYTVTIYAQLNDAVDGVLIVLAWGFVATRLVYSWIYVTANNVQQRFIAFVAGFAALVAMWGYLGFTLLTAGG